jgi:hypothetical protein
MQDMQCDQCICDLCIVINACDLCMWSMHMLSMHLWSMHMWSMHMWSMQAMHCQWCKLCTLNAPPVFAPMHCEWGIQAACLVCGVCVHAFALWARHLSSMPWTWGLRSSLLCDQGVKATSFLVIKVWSRCESHILLSDQGVIKVWKPHPSSWSRCESHILWHSCSCPQVVNKFSKLLQCGSRVYVCGSWARHLSYTLRRPPEMGVVILSRCLRKIGDILV